MNVIGYYVHHHGSGHAHRATAVSRTFGGDLTGLSSLPRPTGWVGNWVVVPDDAGATGRDATANGRLHYVPLRWLGLAARMATISDWLVSAQPSAVVVDVSVEVAALVRLHGIPVLTVAQPGVRTDAAHRFGYDLATHIIAPWPRVAGGLWSATEDDLAKTTFVGPVSRFAVARPPQVPRRRVVVLNGTGGAGATAGDVAAARAAAPDWEWIHLDRAHGTWVADPSPLLRSAAVVIAHAGQNAIAEIAAARRPALVIPQDRPFDEQRTMAAALTRLGLPVEVLDSWPAAPAWPALLTRLAERDGNDWARWSDGTGAAATAAVLDEFDEPTALMPIPA